jgi:hypothetical protein
MHGPFHLLFLLNFLSLVSASLLVIIGIVFRWRCRNRLKRVSHGGWNEPLATNAPIEDEAIQTILGMN